MGRLVVHKAATRLQPSLWSACIALSLCIMSCLPTTAPLPRSATALVLTVGLRRCTELCLAAESCSHSCILLGEVDIVDSCTFPAAEFTLATCKIQSRSDALFKPDDHAKRYHISSSKIERACYVTSIKHLWTARFTISSTSIRNCTPHIPPDSGSGKRPVHVKLNRWLFCKPLEQQQLQLPYLPPASVETAT